MKTVFLSGSRKISRLSDMVRGRIDNMVQQNLRIVVGDANGADKAMQRILAEANYRNVVVFCSGNGCRNNIGEWPARHIAVESRLKGRDFYMEKDRAMAAEADYGLVVWDGESAGSISNVLELLKRRKPTVVHLSTGRRFFTVSSSSDMKTLLDQCDAESVGAIDKKIGLTARLADIEESLQPVLPL